MIFNKMFQEQPQGYLRAGNVQDITRLCRTPPDVSNLENCNVIAVLPVGACVLFSINPENKNPPDRKVKCYFQGNDTYAEKDVFEVFSFIQNKCIAWCEI